MLCAILFRIKIIIEGSAGSCAWPGRLMASCDERCKAISLRGVTAKAPAAAEEAVTTLRNNLGSTAETPAGKAFIDSAETEIARFLEDGGPLTMRMRRLRRRGC